MRFSKFSTRVALSALLLSLPVFADTFTVFNNPGNGNYTPSTTHGNTAGFEFEPDEFLVESISVTFVDNLGQDIATITRNVNGKAGALLFALRDNAPRRWIDHINLVDSDGDDFAAAQLRQGKFCCSGTGHDAHARLRSPRRVGIDATQDGCSMPLPAQRLKPATDDQRQE